MADGSVKIDEMRLRVQRIGADEARGFGEDVARRIADGLAVREGSRRLGALSVRVPVPVGASRDRMATLIAEAILKGFV